MSANLPCFECHRRYGHTACCSKYYERLVEIRTQARREELTRGPSHTAVAPQGDIKW